MTEPVPPVRRPALNRDRVLQGAVALADRAGLTALTIRSLAEALGVKPMALYHHVPNKDAILDGIADLVFGEIEPPTIGGEWRAEMRRRADSARAALRRHPWAIGLLESRTSPGPALLRHHDAVIGTLRTAGFSVPLAAHAFALLDSYTFGFALQEATLPFETPADIAPLAESVLAELPADAYPWFVELATEHVLQPGYDFGDEFGFGLELILDGLEQALARDRGAPSEPPRSSDDTGTPIVLH
jgi:AcrR family transcriptional regulator